MIMKNQSLQQSLKELGLGFVRVDSPTQAPTQLTDGELSQVCGAGTSPGGGTHVTLPPRKH